MGGDDCWGFDLKTRSSGALYKPKLEIFICLYYSLDKYNYITQCSDQILLPFNRI